MTQKNPKNFKNMKTIKNYKTIKTLKLKILPREEPSRTNQEIQKTRRTQQGSTDGFILKSQNAQGELAHGLQNNWLVKAIG